MSREIYILYRRSAPVVGPLIIASTEDLGGAAVAEVKRMAETSRFQKKLDFADNGANVKDSLPVAARENIYSLRWNNILDSDRDAELAAKVNLRMLTLINIYKYFVGEGYDVKLGFVDILRDEEGSTKRTSKSPTRQNVPDNVIAEKGEVFQGRGRKSPFTLNISENISKDLNQTFKTNRGGRVSVEISAK